MPPTTALEAIASDWNLRWPVEWQRHYAAARVLLDTIPVRSSAVLLRLGMCRATYGWPL
ncbi:hypothetical protein [Streptomyces anulatus]|uniref:hypothetical protein n=1 Tax=Streptomyces anulatus TaxID=1892 RepID=UPI0036DB99D0